MAVHLVVAGDVVDGVLFCAVLFCPRDVLDEIWDLIESVPENFLTYFCISAVCCYFISDSYQKYLLHEHRKHKLPA